MSGGEPPAPAPQDPGAGGRERVTGVRVGVGLLLGIITVLVLVMDALVGERDRFRAAAPGTGILLALLSAAAVAEFYALLRRAGVASLARYGAGASFVLLALRSWLPVAGVRPADAAAFGQVGLLLAVLLPVAARIGFRGGGEREERDPAAGVAALAGTSLGLLAVHLPMALLLELRLTPQVAGMSGPAPAGLVLATMVVVACKAGDSAAYFVGRTIGRLPLCWVSPKKTWEGAVAGALAGTAAAGALGAVFGPALPQALAFGLVVNLAGQGGDLVESWLKRACGAKDSGRTFGEMGGALDLVDALLLAGPAGYAFHQVVLG